MGDKIDIQWRSFLLRTEPKATSREKFVQYTQSWLRPAEMEPATHFRPWASDAPPPESSIPAQVAAKVMEIAAPEHIWSYHRALLEAYFTHNRDISSWEVLLNIAEEVGVDRGHMVAAVTEHRQQATQRVIDEHNDAINQGVTAVPTVVINNVLPIPGAQDVDSYEIWINRILERQASA